MNTFARTLSLLALLGSAPAFADLSQEDIQDQLLGIGGPAFHCTVEGDTVTLYGNIDDRIEAQRVVREVARLEGVADVVDNIQVD